MPPKSAAGKPKYSEGEKILCFHGPLLYEAKCLSVDVKDGQIKYFVHYQGWNKNWDEWVGDARIMKFNAVGLQKQKDLKEFYSKPGKKVKGLRKSDLVNQEYPPPEALRRLEAEAAGGGSSEGPAASHQQQPSSSATAKRARESSTSAASSAFADESWSREAAAAAAAAANNTSTSLLSPPSAASLSSATPAVAAASADSSGTVGGGGGGGGGGGKRLRIQIELPRALKLRLADDADLVCRQRRLHLLPPQPPHTVSGILGRFVTAASSATTTTTDEAERERLSEFVAGLQAYFNAVLNSQLLYASERQQYASLLRTHRGAMPASLYGSVHLLRLFVRLGDLLSHTKLDLKCLGSLLDYCDSFLLFLEKNIDTYVNSATYEGPDPRLSAG